MGKNEFEAFSPAPGRALGGPGPNPDVRRLATVIHKTGLKTATVYRGVDDNGEGRDKIKELHSIPKTSWTYDTKEDSDWSWGTDSKYVRVYKLNKVHGITQKEIGELYGTPESTIKNWVRKGKKQTGGP